MLQFEAVGRSVGMTFLFVHVAASAPATAVEVELKVVVAFVELVDDVLYETDAVDEL